MGVVGGITATYGWGAGPG